MTDSSENVYEFIKHNSKLVELTVVNNKWIATATSLDDKAVVEYGSELEYVLLKVARGLGYSPVLARNQLLDRMKKRLDNLSEKNAKGSTMTDYLNDEDIMPTPTHKARHLMSKARAREVPQPDDLRDIPHDKSLICVVENGFFDLSCIAGI